MLSTVCKPWCCKFWPLYSAWASPHSRECLTTIVQVALGAAMVGAFSLGLAITLIGIGLIAAWGLQKASGLSGFDRWARLLPRVSAAIVLLLGLGVTIHALALLSA